MEWIYPKTTSRSRANCPSGAGGSCPNKPIRPSKDIALYKSIKNVTTHIENLKDHETLIAFYSSFKSPGRLWLMCFGLGSLTCSRRSFERQLAFAYHIRNKFNAFCAFASDPAATSESDVSLLSHFGFQSRLYQKTLNTVLDFGPHFNPTKDDTVLLFMPHCDKHLYGEALSQVPKRVAHWWLLGNDLRLYDTVQNRLFLANNSLTEEETRACSYVDSCVSSAHFKTDFLPCKEGDEFEEALSDLSLLRITPELCHTLVKLDASY